MSEEDAFEEIEGEYDEYVSVVFARDVDEAEQYRQLLEDHDIPVITAEDEELDEAEPASGRRHRRRGIPILVPEALLDEASEIIAERDDSDEFVLPEDDLDDDEDEEELGLVEEIEPDLEDDDLFDEDTEEDEDV